ncbi:MAG: DUF4143 domain-containing protein, partial [Malacoplasma sp.]|nr:DUF4143 domain-containing protein [Malacoplasma sp.]
MQEQNYKNKEILEFNPSFILDGKKPRLIDEWQIVPQIWDSVRFWIDNKNETGLFILTESVNVDRKKIIHSGAGRILQIEMSTMTLFESNDSDGLISLKNLFNKKNFQKNMSNKKIKELAFCMCRGGWPFLIVNSNKNYNEIMKSYLDAIVFNENKLFLNTTIKQEKLKTIIKSLARNTGSQLKLSTVLKDMKNEISRDTLKDYINYLESIHLINYLKIWNNNNYRSKTKLLTTPKIYFCDSSLGLYALGVNENNIFNDLKTFGIFFENLVIKDLKVYAQSIDGEVFFYRDENNFEIDAIIELRDGRWAAFEIKLGNFEIDKAAKNLIKFKNKFSEKNQPVFLAVITGTEFCFQREDGVYVIPI